MKFKKYFNEQNNYIMPTLIKFVNPIKIKLCELNQFLNSYKPSPSSEVYLYERFEYGMFDNWVDAIIESKTIDACFSKVHRKSQGIYKAGQTEWCIVNKFWNYLGDKDKFWERPLTTGYNSLNVSARFIDKIEITVYGVYIISKYHKDNFDKLVKGELNE